MARAPRFCMECGGPLSPGDRFCGNCGAPIEAGPAAPPPTSPVPPEPRPAPRPAPKPPEPKPAPRPAPPPAQPAAPAPRPAPAPAPRAAPRAAPPPAAPPAAPQGPAAPPPAAEAPAKKPRRHRCCLGCLILVVIALLGAGVAAYFFWDDIAGGLDDLLHELSRTNSAGATVTAVAFSPDGRRLGVGTDSGRVLLYETSAGALTSEWALVPVRIDTITLGYGGDRVAAGGANGITIMTYDPNPAQGQGLRAVTDLRCGKGPPSPTFLSYQEGDRLLVGLDSDFSAIRFWDTTTDAEEPPLLMKQDAVVLSAALSTDNRYLVELQVGAVLDVHDLLVRRRLNEFPAGPAPCRATAVAASSDGVHVACGTVDDTAGAASVVVWDVRGPAAAGTLPAPGEVTALAYSPDGGLLAGGGNGFVVIWNTGKFYEVKRIAVAPSG